MNGFMSSLTKTKHGNFIVEPSTLLEIKKSAIFDARDVEDAMDDIARRCFPSPENGIYLKGNNKPLFTAYETLYTHEKEFDYFPEISTPVFDFTNPGNKNTVGVKINWRQAVENQIPVYNKSGVLVLKARNNRHNLIPNPNGSIFTRELVRACFDSLAMESTAWGDSTHCFDNLETAYQNSNVTEVNSFHDKVPYIRDEFFRILGNKVDLIRSMVSADKWAIHNVESLGSCIVINSSCDYRHYRANEVLWEQRIEKQANDRAFIRGEVENVGQHKKGVHYNVGINIKNADTLLEVATEVMGFKVGTLREFAEAFESLPAASDMRLNLLREISALKFMLDGDKPSDTINVNMLMILKKLDRNVVEFRNDSFIPKTSKERTGKFEEFDFNSSNSVARLYL